MCSQKYFFPSNWCWILKELSTRKKSDKNYSNFYGWLKPTVTMNLPDKKKNSHMLHQTNRHNTKPVRWDPGLSNLSSLPKNTHREFSKQLQYCRLIIGDCMQTVSCSIKPIKLPLWVQLLTDGSLSNFPLYVCVCVRERVCVCVCSYEHILKSGSMRVFLSSFTW